MVQCFVKIRQLSRHGISLTGKRIGKKDKKDVGVKIAGKLKMSWNYARAPWRRVGSCGLL